MILASDTGNLTINGELNGSARTAANVATFARPYQLTGAGNGEITGKISNGQLFPGDGGVNQTAGGTAVNKYGAGTWTLSTAPATSSAA